MTAAPHTPDALVQVFEHIARTRMAGIPILQAALGVEAVGFERDTGPAEGESGWLGMLVTPWCMNLLWWPDEATHVAPVGASRRHAFGHEAYTFIGAFEPALGAFEVCSLFSPMHDFANADTARSVAQHALTTLRRERAAHTVAAPARRAFLTGRSAAASRAERS